MNLNTQKLPVGSERIREGQQLLSSYKKSKASLEQRIIEDERFWNSRHTGTQSSHSSDMPSPASAWMFSSIVNKHADMMENIPYPICLAREESDTSAADALNLILPVILDRISFSSVYSDAQYDKLKHGNAVYGVFWDNSAENGIGDVDIRRIDLLNLYTEPGVLDINDSSNVFYVSQMSADKLYEKYPWAKSSDIEKLHTSDYFNVADSDKCVIVDWYYKKKCGTKTLLHYIKFTGDTLLYASENDPTTQNGFYEHGKYPFIIDVLYRETNSAVGYGYISITKGTQKYIDRLDENILERSIMSSKPRYLMKKNVGLNREEFLDWNNPIVEVEGDLTEERFCPITLPVLDSSVITIRDSKIAEMREIASNRAVNYGGSENLTSGVAIAALQEAGNKVSRDIITGSWNAYTNVIKLVIDLIRQFYTEERCFRILRPNEDSYSYVNFSGSEISEKAITLGNEVLYRLPVFDVEVRAQKSSAFSRLAQNETIINLYKLGLFNSENALEAIIALEQMELEGKQNMIKELKRNAQKNSNSDNNVTDTKVDSTSIGVSKKISEAVHNAADLYKEKNNK